MNVSQALRRPSEPTRLLLRAAPYVALFVSARIAFGDTFDDCFITFRYAANFAGGHGLVFNPGERVEGYTSLLHVALCAALLRLAPSIGILLKAKIASLLFGLCLLGQTGKLGRRVGLAEHTVIAAQILLAVHQSFAVSSVNALETTLYGTLLLLAVLRTITEIESAPERPAFVSGLLFFFATLARPDCIVVYAAVFTVRLALASRSGWIAMRSAAIGSLSYLTPFTLLLVGRWVWYGSLLPNTYYAKHSLLSYSISTGIRYLLLGDCYWARPTESLNTTFQHGFRLLDSGGEALIVGGHIVLYWCLAAVGMVLFRGGRAARWVFAAVLAAQTAFLLRSGGDWMPGWRFVIPIMPIIAILQCSSLQYLADRFAGSRENGSNAQEIGSRPESPRASGGNGWPAFLGPLVRGGLILLLISTILIWPYVRWTVLSRVRFARNGSPSAFTGFWGEHWMLMANYVAAHAPAGSTIASTEMGYMGFTNMDKRMLDLRGLTDPEIARLPDDHKYTVGYLDKDWYRPGNPLGRILQRRRPELILTLDLRDRVPSSVLGSYVLADELWIQSNQWLSRPIGIYRRIR